MEKHNIPTIFAIFGVTGDLAQKKIFPALIDLYSKNLLPDSFQIVGIARRDLSLEEFKTFVKDAIEEKSEWSSDIISNFIEHLVYSQGQFDNDETYTKAKKVFDAIDEGWGMCSNKLFYLSVPPSLYELIVTKLASSGLSDPCDDEHGWTRVLIEKPFGKDVETAQKLDALLGELFEEEQIYRIDHYLAKQTIQNIMAFRFLNTLFEPLWDNKHIEKVSINLLETNTAKDRGAFYDANGALRDVGQNHVLQMLALVAMEQPSGMKCTEVRANRAKVFNELKPVTSESIGNTVTRAQYEGFTDIEEVADNSTTETFFSVIAHIDNDRWKGVPFELTSGKALGRDEVSVVVEFKDQTRADFMPKQYEKQECNKLTISIQPEEKISLLFWVKVPGFTAKIEPKELSFSFHDEDTEHIDAYEQVLFDSIAGDQTSFISTDEVLSTWEYIMSIISNMDSIPLRTYSEGATPEQITHNTK